MSNLEQEELQVKSVESLKTVNIRDIIKPYLKRWYWFAISVFLCMVLAFLYNRYSTPIYNTSSTVLIKEVNRSIPAVPEMSVMQELGGISGMGTNSVDNEMEIFKSRKLMIAVVKELGLETSIFSKGKVKESEIHNNESPFIVRIVAEKPKAKFPAELFDVKFEGDRIKLSSESFNAIETTFGKSVQMPFGLIMFQKNPRYVTKGEKPVDFKLQFLSALERARGLQRSLNVNLINKNSSVIELSMAHPVPDKAVDILNRLAVAYNRDAILDKNSESQKTADFIESRIKIIGEELGTVENQKERFKVDNKISDIATEAELNLQTSTAARQKQLETEAQLELTNSLLGYLSKAGTNQVLPLNVGINNPEITTNIAGYNQLVIERNRLLQNSTMENPVVQDITKQINSMRSSVVQSLQKTSNGLQIERNALQSEQNRITGRISKIPTQEKLFRNIERQQTIKENLYLLLLQKREEAQIALAIAAPKARIVDYALTNGLIAPKTRLIYIFGLVAGLAIPFLLLYLNQLMNNKIKSKHDVEQISEGISVIGEIPKVGKGDDEVVRVNDQSSLAEAFRILITNLNFMLPKKKNGKVVLVTSSVKGEGKTFVAFNLALTMATPSKKVILVGSDIRNPQLQRYFSNKRGLKGLTEYLHDSSIKPKDIKQNSEINPNCDIIYSGAIAPNPTDLLSNGRYDELINELSADYAYIIVDTAPLMLVTDSFLIANVADATVYVTRSEYTEKDLIHYGATTIKSQKIKNAAFIVNDVDKEYFGYGNKYGYGYGADNRTFFQKIKDTIFP